MSTVDQFVRKCEKAAKELPTTTRTGVNAGARVMASAVDASIGAATHGSFVLAGTKTWKRPNPKPFHARVKPAKSTSNPVALVDTTAGGLMSWLERGTHGHAIGTGGKRGQIGIGHNRFGVIHSFDRTGKTNYFFSRVNTPWGWRNGPWYVSGSPAKHTFSAAADIARPAVVEAVRVEANKAYIRAFR